MSLSMTFSLTPALTGSLTVQRYRVYAYGRSAPESSSGGLNVMAVDQEKKVVYLALLVTL